MNYFRFGNLILGDQYPNGAGSINTGTLLAYGNVAIQNYGEKGTALLKIVGTANQTMTGTSGTVLKTEIASTGGIVSLVGNLNMYFDYLYTSGTVDASAANMSFSSAYGGVISITPGPVSYNNVVIGGNQTVFTLNGNMSVLGALTISDYTNTFGQINSGGLLAYGNVVASNYGAKGTSQIQFLGTSAATLSKASSANLPLGNVLVNKTGGGSLTLASNANLLGPSQNFTLQAGSVDLAGYTFNIGNTLILNGNTLTKNSGVLIVGGATVTTGSLYGGTVAP